MINVGSALSDRAIPLQGGYCAAKHALKAFTDALRMELEEQGLPIAVTLVKPASIDTPFFEKARTYLKGLITIDKTAVGTDSFLGEFGMNLSKDARSVAIRLNP